MKLFLVKIFVFFVIVLSIDAAVGGTLSHMVSQTKGGENGRNNYICDEVNADILIFGSSRAIHHYNPVILSDSLGMTCYNCGMDGNGIILNYGRYQMICQRYLPKVVIYDVMPGFDLLTGDDNHKYLGWLKAYYDRPGVANIFEEVDPTEKYKMMCRMYRYYTKFIQVVSDYIHPIQNGGVNGYRPNEGELDMMKIGKKKEMESFEYDSLKIAYLKKMVEMSPSTRFVFVLSPHWYGMDNSQLGPIREICQKYGFKLFDYSNNPKYNGNKSFFKDGSHLNSRGADEFTKDLASDIKQAMKNHLWREL